MSPSPTDLYLPFLTCVLTPARLRHSQGVMQVMGELAGVYAIDRELAETTGLLHDAAKDLPAEQVECIVQANAIPLPTPEDRDYVLYLHGPVGAAFVRQELGIQDPRVLDAIYMHTYAGEGANYNAPLTWCLHVSDILEPNRDWSQVPWMREGAPRLRELAFAGRLEEAMLLQTGLLIDWFSTKGYPVHPNMRKVYQELAARDCRAAGFNNIFNKQNR